MSQPVSELREGREFSSPPVRLVLLKVCPNLQVWLLRRARGPQLVLVWICFCGLLLALVTLVCA